MPILFHKRLFAYLFCCIILLPAISTVVHECGHYIAMRAFGYRNASVHYYYTDTGRNLIREERRAIRGRNANAIAAHLPFPEEKRYDHLAKMKDSLWAIYKVKKFDRKETLINASGPFVEMAIGTMGVLLLFFHRRSFHQKAVLNVKQWAAILIALFWYSPVVEMLHIFFQRFIFKDMDMRTDEYKVSVHYGQRPWTFNIVESTIGVVIIIAIISFVPVKLRFTFLTAACAGIALGIFLWRCIVGPVVLPG